MKSTIKQVAALSGVSTATVSKYLNGITVKDANKQAIDAAVKKLNYKINPSARGLRTNKTMTVGILLPELDNQFSTSIVSYIENVLMKHGYSTIICDYKSDRKLEKEKLGFLLGKSVDAIVWMPMYASKKILADVLTPIVFIDRIIEGAACDSVVINNAAAACEAVSYLVKCGHSDIAILCGQPGISTSKERLQGYLNALESNNIPVNKDYIMIGEYTEQSGFSMTNALLSMARRPTAIFATNNELTIGSVWALAEAGVEIYSDISFIGFDSEKIAKIIKPKLTVVLQPLKEIGEKSADLVLQRLKDSPEAKPEITAITLDAVFLEQDSVAIFSPR